MNSANTIVVALTLVGALVGGVVGWSEDQAVRRSEVNRLSNLLIECNRDRSESIPGLNEIIWQARFDQNDAARDRLEALLIEHCSIQRM